MVVCSNQINITDKINETFPHYEIIGITFTSEKKARENPKVHPPGTIFTTLSVHLLFLSFLQFLTSSNLLLSRAEERNTENPVSLNTLQDLGH